jgi:ATP-binding cassette subfamily F protein 2
VLQVSDAKKKKAAAKKAKAPGGSAGKESASSNENSSPSNGVQELSRGIEDVAVSNDRSCTCILTSHPKSRDIHLESFTLLFHGHELLVDTALELNFGR